MRLVNHTVCVLGQTVCLFLSLSQERKKRKKLPFSFSFSPLETEQNVVPVEWPSVDCASDSKPGVSHSSLKVKLRALWSPPGGHKPRPLHVNEWDFSQNKKNNYTLQFSEIWFWSFKVVITLIYVQMIIFVISLILASNLML